MASKPAQWTMPAISADSHISETEDCFRDIDPRFEDQRPRGVFDEKRGAILEIADLGVRVNDNPIGVRQY